MLREKEEIERAWHRVGEASGDGREEAVKQSSCDAAGCAAGSAAQAAVTTSHASHLAAYARVKHAAEIRGYRNACMHGESARESASTSGSRLQ